MILKTEIYGGKKYQTLSNTFLHTCMLYIPVSDSFHNLIFSEKNLIFLNCFQVCYRKFFTHPCIDIYIKRTKFTTKNQVDFLM